MQPWASVLDIIYGYQKDHFSVTGLQNECRDIALNLFGQRVNISDEVDQACNQSYFQQPRLAGVETQGESMAEQIPVMEKHKLLKSIEVVRISKASKEMLLPSQEYVVPLLDPSLDNNISYNTNNTSEISSLQENNSTNTGEMFKTSPLTESQVYEQLTKPASMRVLIYLTQLQVFSPYLFKKFTSGPLRRYIQDQPLLSRVRQQVTTSRQFKILGSFGKFQATNLQNMHLALFFLSGKYYSLFYRLQGIRYISTNANNGAVNVYTPLGQLYIMQLLFDNYHDIRAWYLDWKQRQQSDQQETQLYKEKERKETRKKQKKFHFLVRTEKASHTFRMRKEEQLARQEKREVRVLPAPVDIPNEQYGSIVLQDLIVSDASDTETDSDGEEESIPRETPLITSCIICRHDARHTTMTVCGHLFCWRCIVQAVEADNKCPTCRTQCKPNELVRLFQYK